MKSEDIKWFKRRVLIYINEVVEHLRDEDQDYAKMEELIDRGCEILEDEEEEA